MADELTPEQIAAQQAELQEQKKAMRTEVMRELSKEYDFNLFDADGIKSFKGYLDGQKTNAEKMQTELDGYKTKEAEWTNEKLVLEGKLKASSLGIHADNLEDALKLAEGDPNKLDEVIKKYPMFKSKEAIKIAIQDPNNNANPNGDTEVQAYMEEHYKNNPYYHPKK